MEALFLGAVDSFSFVDEFTKGCHVQRLLEESIRVAYVDWRKKRTCHVYQVSPVG
jgi:hypothetical protein